MADIDELIAKATPKVDFSPIGDLPKTYWEGLDQKAKQEQRDVFKGGLPKDENGNVDLSKAYERLLQVGGLGAAKELGGLQMLQNQSRYAAQDQNVYNYPNGPNPVAPQAAVPPQNNGPVVPPSARVVGDNEGVQRGIYDQPTAVGGRPPIQADQPIQPRPVPTQAIPGQAIAAPQPQITPNQRVAQGFSPATPASPESVPQGAFNPEVQAQKALIIRKYAAEAAALGNKERAKTLTDYADSIDKSISQYRESGLKERQSVIEPFVKNAAERLGKSQEKAESLADGIIVSHDLMAQLDSKSGIFSGQWAKQKLWIAKVAEALNITGVDPKTTSTEAFSALVGKKVAQTVKSFGSGTSITNQDREYAAKMEAGDINLDETSMRRILEITDKINRGVIIKHNQQVDDIVKSRPELAHLAQSLKVDLPPKYSGGPPVPGAKLAPDNKWYVADPNRPGKYLMVK